MSQAQIDRIKEFLTAEGFIEGAISRLRALPSSRASKPSRESS